jgi:hypothetical protein
VVEVVEGSGYSFNEEIAMEIVVYAEDMASLKVVVVYEALGETDNGAGDSAGCYLVGRFSKKELAEEAVIGKGVQGRDGNVVTKYFATSDGKLGYRLLSPLEAIPPVFDSLKEWALSNLSPVQRKALGL